MTPTDITITVPVTALEAAARERIAELTRERDQLHEKFTVTFGRVCAVAAALGESAEESTLNAARRVVSERDEARKERDNRKEERDVLFDCHEAVRREREDARQELTAAKVRIDELESAIRTLAKVLP